MNIIESDPPSWESSLRINIRIVIVDNNYMYISIYTIIYIYTYNCHHHNNHEHVHLSYISGNFSCDWYRAHLFWENFSDGCPLFSSRVEIESRHPLGCHGWKIYENIIIISYPILSIIILLKSLTLDSSGLGPALLIVATSSVFALYTFTIQLTQTQIEKADQFTPKMGSLQVLCLWWYVRHYISL